MNQLTTMTGMILSVAPIGEYDKRVVILTKEKGKISAFAKGARRPNSPLAGACTPCNFGKFMLYEGRNSNTLQSAEIENYFAELRTDVEAAYELVRTGKWKTFSVEEKQTLKGIFSRSKPAKEHRKLRRRNPKL